MKSHESRLEGDKIWENPSKIRSKMELKSPFKIKTDYTPSGDQPNAIKELTKGINNKEKLEGDYKNGFRTTGLWSLSRHPNFACEQLIWIMFYLFSASANGELSLIHI